jgi:hypothetical protein
VREASGSREEEGVREASGSREEEGVREASGSREEEGVREGHFRCFCESARGISSALPGGRTPERPKEV